MCLDTMVLCAILFIFFFFFSSRRRHTRCSRDWSSDVCSSDLPLPRSSTNARKDRNDLFRSEIVFRLVTFCLPKHLYGRGRFNRIVLTPSAATKATPVVSQPAGPSSFSLRATS